MQYIPDPHTLAAQLESFALEQAGFDIIGFASAKPLQNNDLLQEWLHRGYHGTMAYLAANTDKRLDPSLIVPGANTVIVVAKNYYTPAQHEDKAGEGKISRYAWGDDYHEVIPPALKKLEAYLQSLVPGSISRHYVDTGPVLEKQWAVKAGIGWQGKHSNIINRSIGSWFFLGVIITTAVIANSASEKDFCGTCTACIDACPTGAIVQPYVVDGTRCISYWTIETKPDIPIREDIAQNLQNWVFGCDICQDICPWNRFRKESKESAFMPRLDQASLSLQEIMNMEQQEFSLRFRKSPVKRTKLAGLKRNAQALLKEKDAGSNA
jgi:epoxyqueuosine reductase